MSAISGDIALTQNKWTIKTIEPDGSPIEGTGISAEVIRRQADGSWKFIIDNPWGARLLKRLATRHHVHLRELFPQFLLTHGETGLIVKVLQVYLPTGINL